MLTNTNEVKKDLQDLHSKIKGALQYFSKEGEVLLDSPIPYEDVDHKGAIIGYDGEQDHLAKGNVIIEREQRKGDTFLKDVNALPMEQQIKVLSRVERQVRRNDEEWVEKTHFMDYPRSGSDFGFKDILEMDVKHELTKNLGIAEESFDIKSVALMDYRVMFRLQANEEVHKRVNIGHKFNTSR